MNAECPTCPPRRLCQCGDAELVRLTCLGILEAYDELLNRYRDPVVLAVQQMTSEYTQDIAQEAFLRAYRSIHQLREPDRFGAWVFIIARNLVRKRARQAHTSATVPLTEPMTETRADPNGANQPERAVLAAERRETVHAAVSELPPELRIPLSLFYTEGWSVRQIADFLELPLTTVHWRLHAGRKRVRALLEPYRD